MAHYDRDYSVTEIKAMIALSERRAHPFNPGRVGHAFSDHHGILDSDVIARRKSAFIISAWTGLHADTLDPMMIGRTAKLNIRTVSDQPFMVAGILNSNFGQAALKLLNSPMRSRMTVHAHPVTGPGGAFRMRVAGGGRVDSSGTVRHVVLVIDNGGRDDQGNEYLHFVTAYPVNQAPYRFKFGPQVLRTRPGVELYGQNGAKSLYLWSSDRQTDDSTLNRIHTARPRRRRR